MIDNLSYLDSQGQVSIAFKQAIEKEIACLQEKIDGIGEMEMDVDDEMIEKCF